MRLTNVHSFSASALAAVLIAAGITRDSALMLKRLCELNSLWCLPQSVTGHSM
jgi:hypothetical protein